MCAAESFSRMGQLHVHGWVFFVFLSHFIVKRLTSPFALRQSQIQQFRVSLRLIRRERCSMKQPRRISYGEKKQDQARNAHELVEVIGRRFEEVSYHTAFRFFAGS